MDEAELNHGVCRSVHVRRRNDQVPRLPLSERRTDREVALGHVADEKRSALDRSLSNQPRAVSVPYENGASVGVQILAKVSQNVVPELLGRLVAEHRL